MSVTRSRRIRACVALAATAGIAAGCGETQTPTTAAAYTHDVSVICRHEYGNKTVQRETEELSVSKQTDAEKLAGFLALLDPFYDKLIGVVAPAGDSAAQKLRSDIRRELADDHAAESALGANNRAAARSAEASEESVNEAVGSDFEAAGSDACAGS